MEDRKNIFGVILLGITLLLFIVGGYFLMRYVINLPEVTEKLEKEEVKDSRINKSKDYIYFENTKEIIEDIYYEDVVINISGFESINALLHQELLNMENVTKVIEELPEDVVCENDIYSFSYREYEVVEYKDYISLVIIDKDYNCVEGVIPTNIKSYIIDKTSNEVISNEDILKEYGISADKVLEVVSKRIEDTQVLLEDGEVIDKEGTIAELKTSSYGAKKAISINKYGKIVLNYIVKSNKINYNDNIELN